MVKAELLKTLTRKSINFFNQINSMKSNELDQIKYEFIKPQIF